MRRFVVLLSVPVFLAGAERRPNPSLPYTIVDTGQQVCYGDGLAVIACPRPGEAYYGQDAQYRGNQPAYSDNGDGTVTDLNTGLVWQKRSADGLYTWQQAAEYADRLVLGGHDDWRFPTIKELYSLVLFSGNLRSRTPYIDTHYFDFEYPDTSTGRRLIDAQYWSATRYVGRTMRGDISAFGFNFADGRIKAYPTGIGGGPTKAACLRCVRGPRGYGLNDFHDNGDGTITDRATGLMWTKADSGVPLDWRRALEYAESLECAGYTDWRVPNAKELQSIVDYTRAPDATDPAKRTAAIDPVFDLTETESWFWTSTTHNDNGFAIYICFGRATSAWRWRGRQINAHGAGAQRSDPKSGNPLDYANGLGPQGDEIRIYNYVRCVRDLVEEAGKKREPRRS